MVGSFPRFSAWTTQLRRNVAAVASRWRHCVTFHPLGIEPKTLNTDSDVFNYNVKLWVQNYTSLLMQIRMKSLCGVRSMKHGQNQNHAECCWKTDDGVKNLKTQSLRFWIEPKAFFCIASNDTCKTADIRQSLNKKSLLLRPKRSKVRWYGQSNMSHVTPMPKERTAKSCGVQILLVNGLWHDYVGLVVAFHQSIYPSLQRIEMFGNFNSNNCPAISKV